MYSDYKLTMDSLGCYRGIHSPLSSANREINTKFKITTALWTIKEIVTSVSTLTHWSQVTHICISILTIIGSDNGWSPGRCQAIVWTNAGILLIGPLGANFSEILIEIPTFSFEKVSSAKWRPFYLGLNGLSSTAYGQPIILTWLYAWCIVLMKWKETLC